MVVVGASHDFLGAVGLIGNEKSRALMWEDQFGKAPEKVGFFPDFWWKAVGTAD